MSKAIQRAIWRNGPQSAGQRFVLLAIADNLDLFGRGAVPTRLLCERTCGLDTSVLQIVARLESDGWLKRERDAHSRIIYTINLDKLSLTPEMITIPNFIPKRALHTQQEAVR